MEKVEILLVEDTTSAQDLFIAALKHENVNAGVKIAFSGEEALNMILNNGRPDADFLTGLKVILMDISLLGVTGFDVIKTIKDNQITRVVPIIALSHWSRPDMITEAYRAGANAYLVKPTNLDEYYKMARLINEFWLQANQTATISKPLA